MKVGTENRKATMIAGGLLLVAVLLFIRMMTAPATSVASPAAPRAGVRTSPATATTGKSGAARNTSAARKEKTLSAALKPSLDPRLRLDLLKSSEDMEYKGVGRDIFSGEPERIPEPKFPVRTDKNPAPTPPPQYTPPPPPPINLKFYGYANRSGRKSIFLSQNDTVFTAREGDIVAGRYRVVKINPTSVEIQDVLSNNTQTIPLTQG